MIVSAKVPRLRAIELENVRGFKSLRLDFGTPAPLTVDKVSLRQQTTLIIGQNGTNKSTLLRSIGLALASPTDAAAMLATETGSFVRHGAKSATIRAELGYADGRVIKIVKQLASKSAGSDMLVDSAGPSAEELDLLVCGYGATRGITGTDSGRDYRVFDSASTLFDYRRELLAPELVLRRLSDILSEERFRSTLAKIARAMGLRGESPRIELGRGGGVAISAEDIGQNIPLEALADGYRVMFCWLIDTYGRALRRDWMSEDGSITGLILVDEIDQHLHPELQTQVVPELAKVLPEAQYVLTTHSPLVALGAHPDQLVVLERDGDEISVQDRVPDYRGFSPEDILSDRRLFATEARNPDLTQLIEHYDELADVSPTRRSDEQQETLRKVARALREAPKAKMSDSMLDEARDEIAALLRNSR